MTHPTSSEFEAPKTHRSFEERTTIRAGCWDGDIHHLRDGKKHPKINGSFEAFQENHMDLWDQKPGTASHPTWIYMDGGHILVGTDMNSKLL